MLFCLNLSYFGLQIESWIGIPVYSTKTNHYHNERQCKYIRAVTLYLKLQYSFKVGLKVHLQTSRLYLCSFYSFSVVSIYRSFYLLLSGVIVTQQFPSGDLLTYFLILFLLILQPLILNCCVSHSVSLVLLCRLVSGRDVDNRTTGSDRASRLPVLQQWSISSCSFCPLQIQSSRVPWETALPW